MIILDEPYASDPLLTWMESSQHPVLDNAFARRVAAEQGRALNLVDEAEAARRIDGGERLYTNAETTLAWVASHVRNEPLVRAIETFKDKAVMREKLAALDPDLFFRTCDASELRSIDFAELTLPFVLKPAVGFCSAGVYSIHSRADWDVALDDIERSTAGWQALYPESVVGTGRFILEGYIGGTEYALDAYFDEEGRTHMLNVLRHDFVSPEDTSDRMYLTSPELVRDMGARFAAWLDRVNGIMGVRNFPVHVEVRVDGDAIRPIEFNPLRFAGLGGTDVAYYAYGYLTAQKFLEGEEPDWDAAFAGREGKCYTMSLLAPPAGAQGAFDYDAFSARFSHVIELRRFDVDTVGFYGFLFMETDASTAGELDFLMHADLAEFLRTA